MIEFGRDRNQVSHTFRHVEEAGLNRDDVREAILMHLEQHVALMPAGIYAGRVEVKGVFVEFRAFRFADGNINIGRITVSAGTVPPIAI